MSTSSTNQTKLGELESYVENSVGNLAHSLGHGEKDKPMGLGNFQAQEGVNEPSRSNGLGEFSPTNQQVINSEGETTNLLIVENSCPEEGSQY